MERQPGHPRYSRHVRETFTGSSISLARAHRRLIRDGLQPISDRLLVLPHPRNVNLDFTEELPTEVSAQPSRMVIEEIVQLKRKNKTIRVNKMALKITPGT